MKTSLDNIDEVSVIYPQKPGFTLLAHKILVKLKTQFGLSGAIKVGADNSLVIVLGDITIYSSRHGNIGTVDIGNIVNVMGKYKQPVVVDEKDERKSVKPIESDEIEYSDCFCSGE